jgi:uncharacterized repeat protein (TIGR03843 family)
VALGRQGAPECLAVYKPRRGEAPLWDFPDGTLYRRERAAYLTARALGWNIVPLTIIRDGPHGIGSVQLFVETADLPGRRELTPAQRQQLACIALFDLITNNADRKGGHCLVAVDGHIWGIDHGLTFHQQAKLRTVLYEFYREPIPPPFLRDLRELLGDAPRRDALQAQLGELLARAEVRAFFARAEQIATSGRYPPLDYYRRPSSLSATALGARRGRGRAAAAPRAPGPAPRARGRAVAARSAWRALSGGGAQAPVLGPAPQLAQHLLDQLGAPHAR